MDKLERVERSVNIYDKTTRDEVEEISIAIPLEKLKSIVTPRDGDILLYQGYELDSQQLKAINDELIGKIREDFISYYYVLECHGIYNW